MGETLRQQETPGEGQQIRNLRKVCFSGKVAVHGVQITCFLGHNDAGKTPLMSMLTRMILATHDILYGDVTVTQYLTFYSQINGFRGAGYACRHQDRQGGAQRKKARRDELTSRMDPYSRRSTWETNMNHLQNRIIMLTTHFMDDADTLGDHIAIMAEGGLLQVLALPQEPAACDVAALTAFSKLCTTVGASSSGCRRTCSPRRRWDASGLDAAMSGTTNPYGGVVVLFLLAGAAVISF
ncbi:hypothetical protein H257_12835 [Aphanomyces astaci]|uniref:ABC transporter domain-containing protein n=1 Tax=Aphanomyces astaci TaxID=112090 RepID=W4FX11_APHAT|nr:hypothetical protein H257_12835 [Aphanomyces astaci]ETV72032.1 hypothetical protein H257_12835 [Aphanomyces astaci]|eukprot:XP_009838475.1 hypothetical protein H257_12835 [Aphanomyces astaci]